MKRYLLALTLGYAASVTMLAAWLAVRAWGYRRFFDLLMRGKHGHPVQFPGLSAIAQDFGIQMTPWEDLAFRLGDTGPRTLAVATLLIFAVCLVAASVVRRQHPVQQGGPGVAARFARWGALSSLLLGISTLALNWGLLRWRVLHPSPWPTVVLFAALLVSEFIALASGFWWLLRGPRRVAALPLIPVALAPLVLWGAIGLYAWANWRHRLVPHDLPMNLAKMAATALMRLETAAEYPNRLETDRLVMFYDRLGDPRRDAQAMDRHLARLEGLLGGPLRAKVFWVRGRLPRLGLGHLSVHGIALGSGESPTDWDTGGQLDRHELAHAALDEYRTYDASPPYFLHEGWAEAQSGVGSVVLARRALEQRAADRWDGIREMAGPTWYDRDDGPVYPLGGGFVDFLIRRGGVGKFVTLYNGSREGRFGAVVQEVYGADLDALEAEFWDDVRVLADRSSGVSGDNGRQP